MRQQWHQRFVVIGLGSSGSSVARSLHARGHDVAAVDTDEEALDPIGPNVPRRLRVSVLAVHDGLNESIAPVPDPDAPLKESDTVPGAGADEHLARLAEALA